MRWKITERGDECAKFASSVRTYCLGEFFRFNFIDSSGLYIGKTGTSDAGRENRFEAGANTKLRAGNESHGCSPTSVDGAFRVVRSDAISLGCRKSHHPRDGKRFVELPFAAHAHLDPVILSSTLTVPNAFFRLLEVEVARA